MRCTRGGQPCRRAVRQPLQSLFALVYGRGDQPQRWLHEVSDLRVDRYGTFVSTPRILPDSARVEIETTVCNDRAGFGGLHGRQRDSLACGRNGRLRRNVVPMAVGKAVSPSVSRRGCTILSCGIRRLRNSIPCVRGSETVAAGRTFRKRPSASAMKMSPEEG